MTEKLCHSDSQTRMKRRIKELCEATGCKEELLGFSLCTRTWSKIREDLTSGMMCRSLCVHVFVCVYVWLRI